MQRTVWKLSRPGCTAVICGAFAVALATLAATAPYPDVRGTYNGTFHLGTAAADAAKVVVTAQNRNHFTGTVTVLGRSSAFSGSLKPTGTFTATFLYTVPPRKAHVKVQGSLTSPGPAQTVSGTYSATGSGRKTTGPFQLERDGS